MALDFSSTFLDDLANILYTPQGIQGASVLLSQRKIDVSKFEFPPVLSSSNPNDFLTFKGQMPLHVFTDCIFFPVMEMQSAIRSENVKPVLAGFDVRYVGTNPQRTRYQKFKRSGQTPLLYIFGHYYKNRGFPLLVTEGILDLHAFLQTDLPITGVSPLTASTSEGFIATLYGMSNNVWFAYDNDEKGLKAIKALQEVLEKDDSIALSFNFLSYLSKDPNQALLERGQGYLSKLLQDQVLSHNPPAQIGRATKSVEL